MEFRKKHPGIKIQFKDKIVMDDRTAELAPPGRYSVSRRVNRHGSHMPAHRVYVPRNKMEREDNELTTTITDIGNGISERVRQLSYSPASPTPEEKPQKIHTGGRVLRSLPPVSRSGSWTMSRLHWEDSEDRGHNLPSSDDPR